MFLWSLPLPLCILLIFTFSDRQPLSPTPAAVLSLRVVSGRPPVISRAAEASSPPVLPVTPRGLLGPREQLGLLPHKAHCCPRDGKPKLCGLSRRQGEARRYGADGSHVEAKTLQWQQIYTLLHHVMLMQWRFVTTVDIYISDIYFIFCFAFLKFSLYNTCKAECMNTTKQMKLLSKR